MYASLLQWQRHVVPYLFHLTIDDSETPNDPTIALAFDHDGQGTPEVHTKHGLSLGEARAPTGTRHVLNKERVILERITTHNTSVLRLRLRPFMGSLLDIKI